jgi:hypothetical protein
MNENDETRVGRRSLRSLVPPYGLVSVSTTRGMPYSIRDHASLLFPDDCLIALKCNHNLDFKW